MKICVSNALFFFIDKDELYLAATLDGLVTCDCHEDFITEIKCPFAHKSKTIEEIEKRNFFLDGNKVLKDSHYYYELVQGQMALACVTKCYFITYTIFPLPLIKFDFLLM